METSVTTSDRGALRVFPDLESLSRATAEEFLSAADSCIEDKGSFAVALSGGSTPRMLFSLLASNDYRLRADWSRIHLFWVDERCVPAEDKESNFGMTRKTLLSQISVPEGNIHRIKGELPPEDGARDYEESLRQFFGKNKFPAFDMIILGMGEDGHTASLFPSSESLKDSKRIVVSTYVERMKSSRVTLTLPVLNNARRIIFLVSGENKRKVLTEILYKDDAPYPAGMVRPAGTLIWMIDEAARPLGAAHLP